MGNVAVMVACFLGNLDEVMEIVGLPDMLSLGLANKDTGLGRQLAMDGMSQIGIISSLRAENCPIAPRTSLRGPWAA